MLKVDHISAGYGKKQVLYDVSFELQRGEVALLTGGNGSGKSTILKCIYNLLPLWSGSIYFNGERINGLKPTDMIRKGIVYIPQKDFYFENLTTHENLQISGNTLPKYKLKNRINQVYELTGLDKLKTKKPFDLSGGERKILAFCMGLVNNPLLILFDEPLAGIDAKNTSLILSMIEKLSDQETTTFLIVEHRSHLKIAFSKEIRLKYGYKESS